MSRAKILIVDDEKHIVSLLSMTLRRSGYEVLTADNGQKALKLVDAFQVDLTIVDQNMPGMTGFELAEKLNGKMPVLMLTARPEISAEQRQHVAGLMHKPFSPSAMVDQVKALIGPGSPPMEQSA